MKLVVSALTDQKLKARTRLVTAQIGLDSTNLTFLFTSKFEQIDGT
jgi:antitoxin component of RelBE/YafQ-DinJ toxin-antitoxin module